jgi:glycosyltransferase involved in cell wall biosynthesis
MKILRLYTRLPPLLGGMENHIAQLTKEQISLGHEVSIYFNKGNKVTSSDAQVSRIPLYKIRPQFIGVFIFYFLVCLRLASNNQKFDLVHIHGDWSSLIFSRFIKKIVGAEKLIMSIHDELSNGFLSKKALSVLIGSVDMVFASGHRLASQLKKICVKNIIVQPSGIKDIFFKDYKRVFDKKSFQVIITSNLVKKKNLGMVLDVAKDLPLLNFVVVGDGPEKQYLMDRIKYENIVNVQILGYKMPDELLLLYYESDIFMISSTKEGTPTAMLEAMACGLPIITSGAGGVENILGSHNYIARKNNKENFVCCISNLIKDAGLMKEISKKNVKLSYSFSWANVAKKIDSYITGIS